MKPLPLNNTYALLALFLAPVKSVSSLETLKNAIINEQIELGPLLLQANIQMCTPLWVARLEQDGLLSYLPKDFQEYLQAIYQANVERNAELKAGLTELLTEFEKNDVESVLLKGAATFVDDLYESPGARFMGDMDILVDKGKITTCESILEKLQYEVMVNENLILDTEKHPTEEL